jgi:glycosyltransferase involved in cell wall biosynthesis
MLTPLSEPMPVEHPIIALVVPCYNEEDAFPYALQELLSTLRKLTETGNISDKSYLFFIDDGSSDRTWQLIERAHVDHPGRVRGLKLARNAGHQNALLAGLTAQIGKTDATISLDVDLQDDISVIEQMIDRFVHQDADIVLGVRAARPSDTVFKRTTAAWYYRLLRWLGTDIIPDHADFRLMSDRALRALAQFGEVHVFLRGLVTQLGFKRELVYFDRAQRLHGETKYSTPKMLALAVNGITSFSVRPLRVITAAGFLLFAAFLAVAVWVLVAWAAGETIQGWASVMLIFLLVSSFQTLALGVIGEYVGKTYFEAKSRPRYIVEKEIST